MARPWFSSTVAARTTAFGMHGAQPSRLRDGIQLSEAITGDGATIFRHACWMDLEGIVSKRIGSRYVSGRTRAWLKTKNPNYKWG